MIFQSLAGSVWSKGLNLEILSWCGCLPGKCCRIFFSPQHQRNFFVSSYNPPFHPLSSSCPLAPLSCFMTLVSTFSPSSVGEMDQVKGELEGKEGPGITAPVYWCFWAEALRGPVTKKFVEQKWQPSLCVQQGTGYLGVMQWRKLNWFKHGDLGSAWDTQLIAPG